MVTIGSGGLGGGGQAMDILKRLGLKRGIDAAGMGAFGAPTEQPRFGNGSAGNPPNVLSMRGEPQPMEPPQPMRPDPVAVSGDGMADRSGMGLSDTMAQTPEMFKRLNNPSIGERIGDFLQSDRGRGALLRSAGATLEGGLGAGIKAGAAYYDDQKELYNKQMNWVSEMGLKTRQTDIDQQTADQTGLYQQGRLDVDSTNAAIDAAVARENARKNRMNENIDLVEEDGRNTRFGIGDQTQRRGQDVQVRGQDVSMRNTDVSAETSRYSTDSTRYTADENRAAQYGDSATASSKLPNGVNLKVDRNRPDYGQIKYDPKTGQRYRRDRFTGRAIPVDE